MSELTRYLVLIVAFGAFLLAGYILGGRTWRGPPIYANRFPLKGPRSEWRRYRAAARAYALSTSTRKTAARFSVDDRCFVRSW
jgi:hypothetical protein